MGFDSGIVAAVVTYLVIRYMLFSSYKMDFNFFDWPRRCRFKFVEALLMGSIIIVMCLFNSFGDDMADHNTVDFHPEVPEQVKNVE